MEWKHGITWNVLQLEHWRSRLHSHFSLSTGNILTISNKQSFNRKVNECLPNIYIHIHTQTHAHARACQWKLFNWQLTSLFTHDLSNGRQYGVCCYSNLSWVWDSTFWFSVLRLILYYVLLNIFKGARNFCLQLTGKHHAHCTYKFHKICKLTASNLRIQPLKGQISFICYFYLQEHHLFWKTSCNDA